MGKVCIGAMAYTDLELIILASHMKWLGVTIEIKVFTIYLKIWYNHEFLPLSRKWKARLSALRPCILNPSWKRFKKNHQDWESTKRVESVFIKRRISIVHCENERGSPLAHNSVQAWNRKCVTFVTKHLPSYEFSRDLALSQYPVTHSFKKINSKAGIYFTQLF